MIHLVRIAIIILIMFMMRGMLKSYLQGIGSMGMIFLIEQELGFFFERAWA